MGTKGPQVYFFHYSEIDLIMSLMMTFQLYKHIL